MQIVLAIEHHGGLRTPLTADVDLVGAPLGPAVGGVAQLSDGAGRIVVVPEERVVDDVGRVVDVGVDGGVEPRTAGIDLDAGVVVIVARIVVVPLEAGAEILVVR